MEFDEEDFLEFTEYKYKKWLKRVRPISAAWEITNACNLSCKYCGLDSGKPIEGELSTEEALDLIDNISDGGTLSLMILGGEPTLRKDLIEIINYASLFMSVGINTNGIFLDKDYAEKLANAGLHEVKISLDGAKAETNDVNRGKGSYKKAIEAIKACKASNIPSVVIETTISNQNYEELVEIIKLASHLAVSIVVNEFIPFGRGKHRKDLVLEKDKRREMQKYLKEKREEKGIRRIGFEERYIICEDEEAKDKLGDPFSRAVSVGCTAGIFSYGIKADGTVIPCPCLRKEIGNLKEETLKDIWKNSETLKMLRDRDKLKGKCGACIYRFVCGGCRGRTYHIKGEVGEEGEGDFMAEDPLCWC